MKATQANGYTIPARAILHSSLQAPVIVGDAGGRLPPWGLCEHCGLAREWLTAYLLVARDGSKLWVADHCMGDILDSEDDAKEVENHFLLGSLRPLLAGPDGKWGQEILVPLIRERIERGQAVGAEIRAIVLALLTGKAGMVFAEGESLHLTRVHVLHTKAVAAEPPKSEWVGTVGSRRTGRLTLRKVLGPYPGQWRERWGFVFEQDAKDQLLWWTDRDPGIKEGETGDFKYTVKKHGDHGGRKQTEISVVKPVEKGKTDEDRSSPRPLV